MAAYGRHYRCAIALLALFALVLIAWPHRPLRAEDEVPSAQGGKPDPAAACIECHARITPGAVKDWKASAHRAEGVGCDDCHGDGHMTPEDVHEVRTVTGATCGGCHEKQFEQFRGGKHALAWASMHAVPRIDWRPSVITTGMKGCGGCHKIGLMTEAQIREAKEANSPFGFASCDACHTRHTFAVSEAREPEACATCHMGHDQSQWDMYKTSKHGVRHALKRLGALPESAGAPTCQDCHMPGGEHGVRTAWGYLGLRMNGLGPYPGEDKSWWRDRVTIFKALGLLDPKGEPTARMEAAEAIQLMRTSTEDFDRERERMIGICSQCHSENFVKAELGKCDQLIREGDRLMAEAIRIVAALYEDGILRMPPDYTYPFPDLLMHMEAPTYIETRLFRMHLKHRMRAFKAAFHSNPEYAHWRGWTALEEDLTELNSLAKEMRATHEARKR
jgi:hypothetical protein